MEKKSFKTIVWENIKVILVAGSLALGIRTIVFEPCYIPSESMVPKLLINDFLIVSKYPYGFSRFSLPFAPKIFDGRILAQNPKRGDIIVFFGPQDPDTRFIKRLIGLPGDKIQMKHGVLYVNGAAIPQEDKGEYLYHTDNGDSGIQRMRKIEETLPEGVKYTVIKTMQEGYKDNTDEFVVPEGHYFGMGDNRNYSNDSRGDIGYIPFDHIIGRAEFLFFSSKDASHWLELWKWPQTLLSMRFERFFNSLRSDSKPV